MNALTEACMADAKPRGRFVWFDLNTSSPEKAPGFYGKVAGWGTTPWDGPSPYTMWTNRSMPIGGIVKLTPENGGVPHWLAYISTPNVDTTVTQAENLGAKILVPATDIPTVGRFAILSDPQGAGFAAFTGQSTTPGHEGPPELGEFSWHDLATHDYPAAVRFYQALFGWEKTTALDMGEAGTYQMFGRNGIVLGGIYNKTPDMPGPPTWLHYIMVDDVERAVDAVKSSGGQVITGPMNVPGDNRIATCADPQGARFAVHQRLKN
jgi:predicted enzyme related to lactoylglutathione lyase